MKIYPWNKGLQLLVIGAATLTSIACGDDQNPGPVDGSILVGSITTGTDFDGDGYLVSVNSSQGTPIGNLDTIWVNALEPGTYQVGLAGVAPNCVVGGEDTTREAIVAAGDTAEVLFEVACEVAPPTGGGGGEPVP